MKNNVPFCVVGIAALWLCFRISFFYSLMGDSEAIVKCECFLCFLAGAAVASIVWFCLPRAFATMSAAKLLSAASGLILWLSFLLLALLAAPGGSKIPLDLVSIVGGLGAGTLFLEWLTLLSGYEIRFSSMIVASAFLLHMACSFLMAFMDKGLVRIVVVSAALIAFACWLLSTLAFKVKSVPDSAAQADSAISKRAFTIVCLFIYAGAVLWGVIPPHEMGVVSFSQYVFTFGVAGITFAFVMVSFRNSKNGQTLAERLRTVLICLFFVALFIALLTNPSQSSLATSTLMAARFCLEAYAIIVLLGSPSNTASARIRVLSLGMIILVFVPSALGNAILPILFEYIGLTQAIDVGTFITVAAFILIVMTVVFLDPSKMNPTAQPAGSLSGDNDALRKFAQQYNLTPREYDVFELLAEGNGQKKISELLHIAPTTVQTHTTAIYRKVGVRTKQELIDRITNRSNSDR